MSADKTAEVERLGAISFDPGHDGSGPGPQTPQETPRYVLHTAGEALREQAPTEWVVERLFSAGSVSLVVGEGGSKKTWAMLDMSVCVAQGVDWLGFETQRAPVLFIDEESGPRRLARRLGQVLRGYGAGAETPLSYVTLAGFNFLQVETDVGELQKLIMATGAKLVIIDALADVMIGGDENSVRDVQPVFRRLRQVAEVTGAAIVVIHHSNKAGSYRGSTAMHGAVDLMLKVDSRTGESYIAFDVEKARDVEPHKFAAAANWVRGDGWQDDLFNLTVASAIQNSDKYSKSERYVLRYLEEHGDSHMTEIKSHADSCSENAARQAVYSLTDKRAIERKDDGGQGAPALYGMVESDLETDI